MLLFLYIEKIIFLIKKIINEKKCIVDSNTFINVKKSIIDTNIFINGKNLLFMQLFL